MLSKIVCRQLHVAGAKLVSVTEALCELNEAVRVAVREGDMTQLSKVIEAIKRRRGNRMRKIRQLLEKEIWEGWFDVILILAILVMVCLIFWASKLPI